MRNLSLATAVSASLLSLAACVTDVDDVDDIDDGDDSDFAAEESELGNFPDSSPFATEVTSANGGGCMDLPMGLPPGSPLWLQQYPCHGGANQRLRFEAVGGAFRIHSAFDHGLCLDIPSGNTVAGQDIQFFPCHSGVNQRWTVSVLNATHGVIKPEANGNLCLDVENAALGQAKIQLFTCGWPVATNRQWRFRTHLQTVTAPACTGNVTIGATTLLPGLAASFAVPTGAIQGTCNSVVNSTFQVRCPANTNWMVANRNTANNGTAPFPIACFRQ